MITLKAITEENFIDAFNLKLAPGQERFVSHPVRSLAQAYVYREHRNALFLIRFAASHRLMFIESNASLSESMKVTLWSAMLW